MIVFALYVRTLTPVAPKKPASSPTPKTSKPKTGTTASADKPKKRKLVLETDDHGPGVTVNVGESVGSSGEDLQFTVGEGGSIEVDTRETAPETEKEEL